MAYPRRTRRPDRRLTDGVQYPGRDMTSIWPQLEPLLARVQKPARYIGCEDGASPPPRRRSQVGVAARPTPTPTRSACPTRACRSSTRSSTSGPTPVAERAYAPWTRPRGAAAPARACRCSRSTPTGRPASSTSSPSTCRPSSSTRTSSTASTSPACPVRAADRGPEHPLVGAGGHCTYNPEPLADFLDFVVLGDGEEVVGEITEVVGAWKAGGRGDRRETCCARWRGSPGVYVPSLYDVALPRRRPPRGVTPRHDPRARPWSRSAPIADLADWPYPKQPARAAHRGRPRPPQRRGVPRLHPGLPLLPGRHDHPPGPRAARRPGAHDDPAAACARTGYDEVALTSPVHRRLLAASSDVVADTVDDPMRLRQHLGVAARACASTPSPSASPRRSRRLAAPASRSRPRPARGACAR